MSVAGALTTAVLPTLAVAAAGYALGTVREVDVEPLSAVTLYLLVPALAFHSLATTTLTGATVARVGVAVLAYAAVMLAVAELVARALGLEEPLRSALVLAATFPNAGNLGIPLSEAAFGTVGRTTGVVFITAQNLVIYTLGVYVASRAGDRRGFGAVREVFRLPLVYAAGAALLARALGVVPAVDSAAMQTVGRVGDASIPVLLLVLGVQLADTDVRAVRRALAPGALKLVVAPAVGAAVALGLGLGAAAPTVATVFVLETAMPAAVIPLMLTIEYADADVDADGVTAPTFVGTVVLLTTLASVATLSVLVAALQSGVLPT